MWQNIVTEFLIIFLVFAPIERLAPIRKDKPVLRRLWQTDVLHVAITGILIALGNAFIIAFVIFLLTPAVPESLKALVASQPVVIQFVEVLVIADLGFYAMHRLFHAVPFLWRFHLVHHSIEDMDALAGHRVHPVDQILTRGMTLAPVFLLGFSPAAIAAFGILYHWQSLLIHSNVNVRLGPMKWVLALPEFHHWHHANHQESFDKNFAGQLPVLDMIFNTMYLPHHQSPRRFGVDEAVPGGYVDQLCYPFRGRSVNAEAVAAPAGENA